MALTPQQNGVSERRNITIIEKARALSAASKLPGYLWTEAINTANDLVNISPTRANQGMTLVKKYYKHKPVVTHLKVFGSLAYVHIPDSRRAKFDSKTF